MSEIEEAEILLSEAKGLLDNDHWGRPRFTVVASMATHALIRANDALSMRFLGKHSTRHEDAPALFREMITQHKIPPEYAPLRETLTRFMAEKSAYDYKGKDVGANEARRMVGEVEGFLRAVGEILGGRD